jgi:DNA-binding Lrp family transcriptional regulator
MTDFTDIEVRILNHIQHSFPLVRRPFSAIGSCLDLPESKVMATIRGLKNRGIIRNIAAIFNPRRLGYAMGLVGMAIADSQVDQAASIINDHPGVSHNYLRDHHFNIWFTLAEESKDRFSESVDALTRAVGASDTLILKTEKVFKIGVKLDVGEQTAKNEEKLETASLSAHDNGKPTGDEKEGSVLLQKDLPVVENPFSALVVQHNGLISEDRLLKMAASLQKKGFMRRYAAVLRHMKAGFTHNAMTVWKPQGHGMSVLDAFLRKDAVSHLYNRTIYPGKWEYPLFAMIHAKSDKTLADIVQRLSRESGITDYQVLHSLREFKKQRVVYFSDEFEQWHHSNSGR